MKYVFVACGAAIHIELLHKAIRLLRKQSEQPIVVVTDNRRNEQPIQHDTVLQIDTPPDFTHAEAAIFLKTGLGKWLSPKGEDVFCYLDTDVFAVSEATDLIFKHFVPPITFARDHSDLYHFSPDAIYDPATEKRLQNIRALTQLYKTAHELDNAQKQQHSVQVELIRKAKAHFNRKRPLHAHHAEDFQQLSEKLKIWSAKLAFSGLKSLHRVLWRLFHSVQPAEKASSFERIHQLLFQAPFDFKTFAFLQTGLLFDKQRMAWFSPEGKLILEENFVHDYISKDGRFLWDATAGYWRDRDGQMVDWPGSDLLRTHIKTDFGVDITQTSWNHWNGGVFLFAQASLPFLQQWHEWTTRIFQDPNWKTRDQGTLAAVVWDRQLDDHPTLPIEYNFIADYYVERYKYLGGFTFESSSGKTIRPNLIHIFHEAGNPSWELWNDIEQLID
jgi:hypothetical protein